MITQLANLLLRWHEAGPAVRAPAGCKSSGDAYTAYAEAWTLSPTWPMQPAWPLSFTQLVINPYLWLSEGGEALVGLWLSWRPVLAFQLGCTGSSMCGTSKAASPCTS